MKFGMNQIQEYSTTFETPYTKNWNQLEIGEEISDKDSATIYCGGSVSSIDWAPSSGNSNFLAVACNSSNEGIKLNITETCKSCVQLYEIKNLTNEK